MMKEIAKIALSGLFQLGGAIALGYITSWAVGVCVFVMFIGHNMEKH